MCRDHRVERADRGALALQLSPQVATDPERCLIERENREREARGEDRVPLDTSLIEALRAGIPDCSGVALGVDRLLMAILKLDDIDSVLAFSHDRV